MLWSIMGTIAAICTTVGFIPQIVQGIKTRELKDVSPIMLTLLLVGCSLWLAYGVHLKDPIIALANGFTLSFVFTIFFYVLCLKEITQKYNIDSRDQPCCTEENHAGKFRVLENMSWYWTCTGYSNSL